MQYMTLQAIFFANKDARLYGTIIYPGSKFRNQDVDIQAGVAVWNDKIGSYDLLTDPKLGSFMKIIKLLSARTDLKPTVLM